MLNEILSLSRTLLLSFVISLLFSPLYGYDGYREGYLNDFLPGAVEDERQLPNLPLTTDTNRFSDGISSSSYFGVNSPAFPEYDGGLAQTDNRLKFYVDYTQNAKWQGLGGYLQGEARQEEARLDHLAQFNRTSIIRGLAGFFSDLRLYRENHIATLNGEDPGNFTLTHNLLTSTMSEASKMTTLSMMGISVNPSVNQMTGVSGQPFLRTKEIMDNISHVCKMDIERVTSGTDEFPASSTVVTKFYNDSDLDPLNSNNREEFFKWVDFYWDTLYQVAGMNRTLEDGSPSMIHLLPPPSTKFQVFAAVKWNPSNFAMQEGEKYNITAFAPPDADYTAQSWTDGGIRVKATGYNSYYDAVSNCYVALGRCRGFLKMRRRLQTANWMSLICAIGEFVRPVQEVNPGSEDQTRFVPLDESRVQQTLFEVGLGVTNYLARHNGQLICMANDAHNLYWNNAGSIEVTITRTIWPPTEDAYYDPLKLPACDSAFAVYQNKGNWTLEQGCNPNSIGAGWPLENVRRGLNDSASNSSDIPTYRRLMGLDL